MNRSLTVLCFLILLVPTGLPAAAQPLSDEVLKSSLRLCNEEPKIQRQALNFRLPKGFSGELILVDSPQPSCGGQYAAIVTPSGAYFLGAPWFLNEYSGSPAEKIRSFGWQRLEEILSAEISPKNVKYGLQHVRVNEKTDYGDIVIEGWVDPEGTVFFPGDFIDPGENLAKSRLERVATIAAKAPSKGDPAAPVWVIEFSDFQCPSCRAASTYLPPILEKYGNQVRYTRIDLPLLSMHPWAFPAALAGRAIYQQSPEAFWDFKKQIYDSQSELSIFTLGDFARNFVKDHQLDLESYDAVVESPELKAEILAGVGDSYSLRIMGTPTYLVNGVIVDSGAGGESLDQYIARILGMESAPEKPAAK